MVVVVAVILLLVVTTLFNNQHNHNHRLKKIKRFFLECNRRKIHTMHEASREKYTVIVTPRP